MALKCSIAADCKRSASSTAQIRPLSTAQKCQYANATQVDAINKNACTSFGTGVLSLNSNEILRGGCSRSFLRCLCRGRCLTPPFGLWRGRGRFTDQFRAHNTGHEKFWPVIVKIYRSALPIGSGYDSQPIHIMLDRLAFLHCLHVFLLGRSLGFIFLSTLFVTG